MIRDDRKPHQAHGSTVREMRNAVQLQLRVEDCDLLLNFFGCVTRPFVDDLA